MLLTLLLSTAFAQDLSAAAPPAPPAAAEEATQALTAQLLDLQAQVKQLQLDAFLRDAEIAAAASPPPPQKIASNPRNLFNPGITAFGDVLGSYAVAGGQVQPGSGPWLRSLELDLRADVDPFAKAVAVLAVEQEPPLESIPEGGEYASFGVSPEEVYLDLVALPGGFSAQIGTFRQPFGITNKAHPHDYPWPDTPGALQALLGEEGWADTGAQLVWRPSLGGAVGFTLNAGVVRGTLFDPTLATPALLGRAELFGKSGDWELSLGSSAATQAGDTVVGGDAMVRWRGSVKRSVIALGEALTRGGQTGGYAALQVQPAHAFFLGARADVLQGERTSVGAYGSYYTSEFLRLRLGGRTDGETTVGEGQVTFVWGSHPVEPYWVNR